MWQQLDRRLSLRQTLWLFPVAFFIHDAEEVFTMERFVRARLGGVPVPLARLAHITTGQFAVAVVGLLVVCVALTALAAGALRPGWRLWLLQVVLAACLANAFTHVAQTLIFRAYTPGVITAVLVSLPYGVYVFRRLLAARLIRARQLAGLLVLGLFLIPALALPTLLAATWLWPG